MTKEPMYKEGDGFYQFNFTHVKGIIYEKGAYHEWMRTQQLTSDYWFFDRLIIAYWRIKKLK